MQALPRSCRENKLCIHKKDLEYIQGERNSVFTAAPEEGKKGNWDPRLIPVFSPLHPLRKSRVPRKFTWNFWSAGCTWGMRKIAALSCCPDFSCGLPTAWDLVGWDLLLGSSGAAGSRSCSGSHPCDGHWCHSGTHWDGEGPGAAEGLRGKVELAAFTVGKGKCLDILH